MEVKHLKWIRNAIEYGNLDAELYYKGHKCELRVIQDKLSSRLNALHLLEKDLKECLDFIDHFKLELPNTVKIALFKSLIITYGRCFADGTARGVSLKSESVFKKASDVLKSIHQYIITIRNTHVAHHDNEALHLIRLTIAYPPKAYPNKKPVTLMSEQFFILPPIELIHSIENVITYVIEYVLEQAKSCRKKILTNYPKP